MERREAPGGLRNLLRSALRSADLRAKLPGPKVLRGWGSRGARAPAKGPAPPGAPSRHALSAAAPFSVIGVAIDDALNEQDNPVHNKNK
jgi:hypothetical protein